MGCSSVAYEQFKYELYQSQQTCQTVILKSQLKLKKFELLVEYALESVVDRKREASLIKHKYNELIKLLLMKNNLK